MPWEKGVSGNPQGRRLGSKNRRNTLMMELMPLAIEKARELISQGDAAMVRAVLDKTVADMAPETFVAFTLAESSSIEATMDGILKAVAASQMSLEAAERLFTMLQKKAQVAALEMKDGVLSAGNPRVMGEMKDNLDVLLSTTIERLSTRSETFRAEVEAGKISKGELNRLIFEVQREAIHLLGPLSKQHIERAARLHLSMLDPGYVVDFITRRKLS